MVIVVIVMVVVVAYDVGISSSGCGLCCVSSVTLAAAVVSDVGSDDGRC